MADPTNPLQAMFEAQREMMAQSMQAFLDAHEEVEAQTVEETTRVAQQRAEATEEQQLEDIEGLGSTYADRLREEGVHSISDLADADVHMVSETAEVSEDQATSWTEAAQSRVYA
jgi:predicted flap endonuclease-1-like 5' DNA nuclease